MDECVCGEFYSFFKIRSILLRKCNFINSRIAMALKGPTAYPVESGPIY